MKIKIVFLATPDIAIQSFEYFINSPSYEVSALVVQPAKAQNRGHKLTERNITKLAKKYNIKIFEPFKISKDEYVINELKKMKPDFFITFAFGQILSQEVIDIPKFNTINLHASLLPKYRGANPIAASIIDGNKKTGITTMKTVLELDKGDICLQEEIEITPDMNVIELMQEISSKSPCLLDKTLKGIFEGTLKSYPQDDTMATYTKKMQKEEKLVNWNTDATVLHNKIRAMYQINTNHTYFNGKIIKILKTTVINDDSNTQYGEILSLEKDGIVVKCCKDALKLITIKPEGKGEMKASDWARGARIKQGDKFN